MSALAYQEPSLGDPGAATIAARTSLTGTERAVAREMAAEEGRLRFTVRVDTFHSAL